jgi:Tol biopolymer transport system component
VSQRMLVGVVCLAIGLLSSGGSVAAAPGQVAANGRILISSGSASDSQLVGVDAAGKHPLCLVAYGGVMTGAYSPDGLKVVLSNNTDGDYDIFVMNADGTGQRQLTHNSSNDQQPAWSPDGKQIAFTSNRDGDFDIYVMNADGSNPVNLTNAYWTGSDLDPHWSPDGQSIAYVTSMAGTWDIYSLSPTGSSTQALTNGPSSEWFDDWAPDGNSFLAETNLKGNFDIYRYQVGQSLDGTSGAQPVPLAATAASEGAGTYSPDGQKIAFSSNRDGDFELIVMNADGTNMQQLTHNQIDDAVIAWQPLYDVKPPRVRAITADVRPGRVVQLHFSAADDSGRVTADGYVRAGKHIVGYFDSSFGARAGSATREFRWRAPKSLPAKLTFCVIALDPSGNESATSCVPLRVHPH